MKSLFFEIICALLMLLFLYTALSKSSEFSSFRDTLGRAPLIGKYNFTIAWILPAIELMVTVLLFIPRWKMAGIYLSLSLLVLFTGYLAYIVLFRSHHLPCSCGGVLKKMSWQQHIVFNLLFILLCFAAIKIFKSGGTREGSIAADQ